MNQKYSVTAAKRRVVDHMLQKVILEMIVEAIAFDHWEITEKTSYLQEGNAIKKWRW